MKKLIIILSLFTMIAGCNYYPEEKIPVSDSGVSKVKAKVKIGSDGMTVEQRNIKKRIEIENDPGSIKHLYIISAYSGQTIIYSTVKGKVTSSGKRLTPYSVVTAGGQYISDSRVGISIKIGEKYHYTSEVLQDDGTYGSSIPYLYWWDVQGRYHQHYIAGGQIVHVSNNPISVKNIIINMEIEKN